MITKVRRVGLPVRRPLPVGQYDLSCCRRIASFISAIVIFPVWRLRSELTNDWLNFWGLVRVGFEDGLAGAWRLGTFLGCCLTPG
eukprot:1332191-Amorphochlora_amoeboformis.AAC.3